MITVAILGCGSIADEHVRSLQQIPGVAIRTYCDIAVDRAQDFLGRFGGVQATDDARLVFADDAIDAVYICTRTDSHAALALSAAEAGKAVMMEKPIAMTLAECHAIADAVDRAGIPFMSAFKLRFAPAVAHARAHVPRPFVSSGQVLDIRWPDEFWGNDPVQGGGNVLSQGCHATDLLYFLHGSEPVRVYAESGNFHHPGLTITDTLTATIRFANGSISSLTIADAGRMPLTSKFSFQTADGIHTAQLHDRLRKVLLDDGTTTRLHETAGEDGMLEENREFINALTTGRSPSVTVRDGIRASLVLLKAFESFATGQPQAISL